MANLDVIAFIQNLFNDWLQSPNRDLATTGIVGSIAFAIWYYRSVTWHPKHIGTWTKKSWDASNIDDKAVKVLCSIAPFLADVLLVPIHILKGLGLAPTTRQKLERMDDAISDFMIDKGNGNRTDRKAIEAIQDTLLNLRMKMHEQREKTGVEIPLEFSDLERKLNTLGDHVTKVTSSVTKLEEAYVESLDDTVARLFKAEVTSRQGKKLDANDPQELTDLYEECVRYHDAVDHGKRSTACGC